jgi:hypothetical protein
VPYPVASARGRNARPAAAWTPASIAGLAAWHTAGPAWCFTDAGGTVAAGDGDAVRVWRDRSANADHATQATAGNRPLLKAGWGVRFDGTDDYLSPAVPVNPSTGGAIYFVQTTTGDGVFAGRAGGSNPQVRIGQDVNVLSVYNGSDNPQSSALATPRGTRTVSGYVFTGELVTFYENGTARGVFSFAPWIPANGDNMSAFGSLGGASLALSGDIHELVVVAAPLSGSDRALLDAYFRSQWATP